LLEVLACHELEEEWIDYVLVSLRLIKQLGIVGIEVLKESENLPHANWESKPLKLPFECLC